MSEVLTTLAQLLAARAGHIEIAGEHRRNIRTVLDNIEQTCSLLATFRTAESKMRRYHAQLVPIAIEHHVERATRLTLADQWLLEQPLLRPRVNAADALYQKLLDEWAKFAGTEAAARAL